MRLLFDSLYFWQFDIIHFHTDFLSFGLLRHLGAKCITTIHGRCDIEDLALVYAEYQDMKIVSISDNQRIPLLNVANWYATVYHGIPPLIFNPNPLNGGYLAFLGRICPGKIVLNVNGKTKNGRNELAILLLVYSMNYNF